MPTFVLVHASRHDGSASEELSTEPAQPFGHDRDLSEFYSLDLPARYINATGDTALPQVPEWRWHPRVSSRLETFRLVQLSGSHEIVFTDPDGLAEATHWVGRK